MSKSRHNKRQRRARALEARIRAVADQQVTAALATMVAEEQSAMALIAVKAVQTAQRNGVLRSR